MQQDNYTCEGLLSQRQQEKNQRVERTDEALKSLLVI